MRDMLSEGKYFNRSTYNSKRNHYWSLFEPK
jgi:hypothetical protein